MIMHVIFRKRHYFKFISPTAIMFVAAVTTVGNSITDFVATHARTITTLVVLTTT